MTNRIKQIDKRHLDNFLSKDNTVPYTPIDGYNPTTKQYVDDINKGLIEQGVWDADTNTPTIHNDILNLNIFSIIWQSDNIVRYSFKNNPDISTAVNAIELQLTNCQNSENNGNFKIVTVNNTSKYIDVENDSRSDGSKDELYDVILTNVDVDTIIWQNGNTVRYTFNGTPDLSKITTDGYIISTNAIYARNNGEFAVVGLGTDYVDITNPNSSDGTQNEFSDCSAVCDIKDSVGNADIRIMEFSIYWIVSVTGTTQLGDTSIWKKDDIVLRTSTGFSRIQASQETDNNYSYDKIVEVITIPENQQMAVFGKMIIENELIVEGTLINEI